MRLGYTDTLQLPQLFTNYKAKSADGLSMAFLVVWLLGDVTNLVGSYSPSTRAEIFDSANLLLNETMPFLAP